MNFSDFELHPFLLGAIQKLNFQQATPVQSAVLPHVLEGRDVAGLAQTGTGKTAAFLLPLMERILRAGPADPQATPEQEALAKLRAFPDWKPNQFVLVLVPTRELAEQVYENALVLRGEAPIRAVSIYGGVSYDKQKQGLRDGVEFVIATPGRLIDLYKENLVDLKQVRAIVFDEADRMFDMGFKDDMKYILQRVPKERQFLVFSATLNLDVLGTAYQFGANPIEVDVSRDQAKAENVADSIFHVGTDEKPMYLLSLLKKSKPRQAIIFSNFKMNVPRITQFLNDNKMPAVGISSLLTQAQRNRVMEQFKGDSDRNILVATDVAARGLDIKGVDMVMNYELPDDPENYVHRIGRTGRAGATGLAFSMVSDRDVEALQRIEDYLRHKVSVGWMEDSELVKEFKNMPSDREGRRGPRPDRGGPDRGSERGGRRDERHARGGEGSRRRGGRGPERGRDSDRERQPRQGHQPTEGASLEAGAEAPSRQHRDRALGRHSETRSGEGSAPRSRPEPRHGGGQQGGGRRDERGHDRGHRSDSRRDHPRDQHHSRPTRAGEQPRHERGNGRPGPGRPTPRHERGRHEAQGRKPTPVAGPSLGQKVSKFFKKLFGAKP